jgi:2,3,4,5-tetrahydropyridine-2-carboxylate N-succinyltransferase
MKKNIPNLKIYKSVMPSLQEKIHHLFSLPAEKLVKEKSARKTFEEFKAALNAGTIRAAEKVTEKQETFWKVNQWVKQGILVGFRLGKLVAANKNETMLFFDKDTYPLKKISEKSSVRIVPGGSSVRDGCYVAASVVIMPPAYINVGAYVDAGTMVDSHALVGSCGQVGKNVHLSAASQIGGVLEPIGAMPVIIEDGVMIGGNCGIYEGTIVQEKAVIGTGVILNGSTPVYDIVNERILRKTPEQPLVIPKGAVVVAGSRQIKNKFATANGLSLYTPIIIKYRDEKTDKATSLEDLLR